MTNQPYCGQYLTYLLFDENSTADELLIKKAVKNCTDIDFIQFMSLEEIVDAEEYFDKNKMLVLRDKFKDQQIFVLFQKSVAKCKSLSKKYNISEYIKQANLSLIELAKDQETTAEQFQEAVNKCKNETGYDTWNRFAHVRGNDEKVKLMPINQFSRKSNVDRDSYNLKLIRQGNQSDNDDSMEFNQSLDKIQFTGLS